MSGYSLRRSKRLRDEMVAALVQRPHCSLSWQGHRGRRARGTIAQEGIELGSCLQRVLVASSCHKANPAPSLGKLMPPCRREVTQRGPL